MWNSPMCRQGALYAFQANITTTTFELNVRNSALTHRDMVPVEDSRNTEPGSRLYAPVLALWGETRVPKGNSRLTHEPCSTLSCLVRRTPPQTCEWLWVSHDAVLFGTALLSLQTSLETHSLSESSPSMMWIAVSGVHTLIIINLFRTLIVTTLGLRESHLPCVNTPWNIPSMNHVIPQYTISSVSIYRER